MRLHFDVRIEQTIFHGQHQQEWTIGVYCDNPPYSYIATANSNPRASNIVRRCTAELLAIVGEEQLMEFFDRLVAES